MPTWLKVLLIVFGVIVLVIGGLTAGIYVWWQNQGSALMSSIGEGTTFGKDKDRAACVDETVARIKKEGGFTAAVKVQLFFEECLKAAKPVAGFCDDVPPKSEMLKSATWLEQINRKHGLNGTYEVGLLAEIQKICDADAGRR